jgi:hypothetical protein
MGLDGVGSLLVIFLCLPCVSLLCEVIFVVLVVSIYMVSESVLSHPLGRVSLGYSYLWWMKFFVALVILGVIFYGVRFVVCGQVEVVVCTGTFV